MRPCLDLLLTVMPSWFTVRLRTATRLEGVAAHGPWKKDSLDLSITAAPCPVVGETHPGSKLPAFCPDRHIQGDHTFCVGLKRAPVDSLRKAEAWWSDLDQYLECQAIAEATRVWPPQNALDHGQAGVYHQRALRLASRLGIVDDYLEAYFDLPSWITGKGLNKLGGRGVRLTAPAVRHSPRIRGGRKARQLLAELVIVERARRRALAKYHAFIEAGSQMCCGAMRDCRFPKSVPLAA